MLIPKNVFQLFWNKYYYNCKTALYKCYYYWQFLYVGQMDEAHYNNLQAVE